MLEILRVNLEASGFTVIGATDGLSGLQAFEMERPDLVILDVNLPVISGFRLLELIRQGSDKAIPVLALTAMDFVEAEELADYGLDAFISKPFKPEDLISMVRHLLERETMPAEGPSRTEGNDAP